MGEESWYAQTGKEFFINMRTMEQTEYNFVLCENIEQFLLDAAEEMKKSSLWNSVMEENEKFDLADFLEVL